ncbi:MAG: hypothetical protein GTO03_14665 [Planctomycetales bacterium]|nr:hypothetical protein [Planctomycetales bacterium]
MLSTLLPIFVNVIAPILLLIALGGLVHRQFRMDVEALNRLAVYVLVPAFLFVKVYESRLSLTDLGVITYGVLVPVFTLGLLLYLLFRALSTPGRDIAVLLVSGLVFNAGNFGLPVAELFYERLGVVFPGMQSPSDGAAVQAIIIMISNLSVWFFGYGVIRLGQGHGLRGTLGFFRLPMIYVLVAAFVFRQSEITLPGAVYAPLQMLAAATVPIMLLTLGAQLSETTQSPPWRLVGPVLVIKLLLLPAATAGGVWWFGLWPWPGAQLIIAAAAPTAVNVMVLSIQLEGDAHTAASCVFWTTLAAAVTVTCVLALVQHAATGG